MKKITLQDAAKLTLAIAVAGFGMAGQAKADCAQMGKQFTLPHLAALSAGNEISVVNDNQASAVVPDNRAPIDADPSIVGLWDSKAFSGGQLIDEGFEQWNADGTEVLNDTPPPQTGNVCLGVFVKSAQSTYKLKHPSWTFDSNGNLTGTAIIRELVIVGRGGNTYSGTYTIDFYDLNGKHLQQFGGTIQAQRITVDF